jgi:CMP-N-acetylneuraminic acid synthetase
MNLCYIQARAGSKRFPGKNTALWNGFPMVEDAIKKASTTECFDITAISSNDPICLHIAKMNKVLPLWRSEYASSDSATDDDVAKEVLAYFHHADIVCKLYPCVPLLKWTDIYYAFHGKWKYGIYSVDKNGKDAGAFYIFRKHYFDLYGTLALNAYPWDTYPLDVCQDINTPEDLEEAKRKAAE